MEEIKSILKEALINANSLTKNSGDIGKDNRERSKNFVEDVASSFRKKFKNQDNVYVLSKHHAEHRDQFGLNELLYDILICETEKVESASQHQTLTYIKRAIWQIESEFAKNTREAIYDFNKLVIGNSENKLFIGPQVNDPVSFLGTLKPAAGCCNGNVFVALVPHPNEWNGSKFDLNLWQFSNEWIEL